jgi:hypothetical protein
MTFVEEIMRISMIPVAVLGALVGLSLSWRVIEERLREGPFAYAAGYTVFFVGFVFLTRKWERRRGLFGKAAILLVEAVTAGSVSMMLVQYFGHVTEVSIVKRLLVALWWSSTVLLAWLPGVLAFALWVGLERLGANHRPGSD